MGKNIQENDFEALLAGYDYKFKSGDLVKGIVCGYESDCAIVDIGAKSPALVHSKEASIDYNVKIYNALEVNQEYEFLIISDEDENGQFLLSRKRVDLVYSWKELEEIKETDKIVNGTVAQIVKGGMLVDIIGIKGFVPSSQVQEKETPYQVGDKIEVKILALDKNDNNLVLSNKKVYSDTIEQTKKEIFEQIEVGQVIKGKVVRITNFGAFVDIGGLDCLLPLSQISWRWVEHPTDLLKIGEVIDVAVFDIDYARQRITLSLKNVTADPWDEIKDDIHEGDTKEGVVTRIKNFGAFIEIHPGVEALLPHNKVVEFQNINNRILEVDDKINVVIVKFNPEDKRIALSIQEDEVANSSAEV